MNEMKIQLESQQDLLHVQMTLETQLTDMLRHLPFQDPTEREITRRYIQKVSIYQAMCVSRLFLE
jgi:phage regulator Rha-like protein